MSMRESRLDPEMTDAQSESWIEDEIQRELEALTGVQPENEEVDTVDSDAQEDTLQEEESLLPSMLDYMNRVTGQTDRLKEELEECDELLHQADIVSARQPPETQEIWQTLAKEQGGDPETLRQQILADIARQDEEDQLYSQEHTDENANEHPELYPPVTPDLGNGSGAFLTALDSSRALGETNAGENSVAQDKEETERKTRTQLQPSHDDDMVLRKIGIIVPNAEGEPARDTGEVLVERIAPVDEKPKENGLAEPQDEGPEEGLMLKPGEGVIAEISESDVLEQQSRQALWELDGKKRKQEMERKQEEENRRNAEEIKDRDYGQKRRQKQAELQEEENLLAKEKEARDAKLKAETEEMEKKLSQSLQEYQVQIESLAEQTKKELAEFEASKREEKARQEQRQQKAAVKLQACYRGYRARKLYGSDVKNKLETWKEQQEIQRISAIEEQRRKTEQEEKEKKETAQRLEEEKKEAERRKEQERLEAEKKKEADAKKKKEEEERKIEEEKKKKEQEELRKKEEERKRKQEEERKKKEAEDKRKKEEERLRKEEEERKTKEAEEKRKEEEKKQKEAEERKREEEKKAKEAEERKQEEARLRREAEEKKKKKEEEEERRKHNTANTSKSQLETVRRSQQGLSKTPRPVASVSQKEWGDYLPAELENKRLSWIKQCKPWSKIKADLKIRKEMQGSRKPPRRPISAKKLPPLTDSQILSGAGVTSLQQVMTVELHDLPGCTLKPLAQCPRLHSLTVNSCGLIAVDDLEPCKQLQYLDLKHNCIEMVQLRDLVSLLHVDLSHNSLTSVHGLDGCAGIRHLDLNHNRITRIGGLSSLKKLHTLNLSYNQLITTRSLGEAPTIQHLDLSHNHLPNVDDLEKLGLLQRLDVSGNNLLQVPRLANQILISHLVLHDNSVSTLASLSESWLPMLQCLELGQNSLSSLADLQTCVLLETVDLANNQLLDMESVLPGLCSLHSIQHLKLEGNPVSEETDYRNAILQKLPMVKTLDGSVQSGAAGEPKRTNFELMCLAHSKENRGLQEAFQQAVSKASSKEALNDFRKQYYDKSHQLAEDHRFSHEYGETSHRESPSATFNSSPSASDGVGVKKSQAEDMKAKFEAALQGDAGVKPSGAATAKSAFDSAIASSAVVEKFQQQTPASLNAAVNQETAQTSSYSQLAASSTKPQIHPTASSVPANVVQKIMADDAKASGSNKRVTAAVKIQALWRGYQLRKKLQYALNFARCEEMEVEEDDDDDMNFGEEIDLGAFDFNVDDLEKDWVVADTPQLPQSHPVLGKPPNGIIQGDNEPIPHLFDKPPHPPSQPRRAWKGADSPMSDVGHFPSGKPPLPPLSRMSDGPETQRTTDTHATGLSKKGEKISEEWGFKDNRTAELMLQRAKKLKYNAARKKKISQLDPKQRLALFRKLEESTKLKPVQPPPRKQAQRKDYFQAREDEEAHKGQVKVEERQEKVSRTYEWVHTQVGSYNVGTSTINQGLSHHGSEGNLPKMDPNVIIGGRALLTGSPHSMDIQSVESGSLAAAEVANPRRWSLASGSGHNSAASGDRLPPIKTSSAPNSALSAAAKIGTASWRQPVVNQSVGWGGGKKRANRR